MEKQRRISRTEANQFLNDLGKPVFQASAASSYDSVRTAFDETSRLVYKWKFADGRKRQRSRSGSIMDPLRDALTRLSKSPSSEEIPYETRPRHSSVDLSQVSLVVSPLASIKDGRCLSEQKPTKDMHRNNNFLQIPSIDQVIHFKRERSHSFA